VPLRLTHTTVGCRHWCQKLAAAVLTAALVSTRAVPQLAIARTRSRGALATSCSGTRSGLRLVPGPDETPWPHSSCCCSCCSQGGCVRWARAPRPPLYRQPLLQQRVWGYWRSGAPSSAAARSHRAWPPLQTPASCLPPPLTRFGRRGRRHKAVLRLHSLARCKAPKLKLVRRGATGAVEHRGERHCRHSSPKKPQTVCGAPAEDAGSWCVCARFVMPVANPCRDRRGRGVDSVVGNRAETQCVPGAGAAS
jgi:hypothetical protein